MANVAAATKHWAVPSETFEDNLSGSMTAGDATLNFNSLAEYSNGDTVVVVINPGAATEVVAMGTKSGNQLTGVIYTEGDTAANHSAGTTVVDYVTATHQALLVKGLKVQHNDDGTHKNLTSNSLSLSGNLAATGNADIDGTLDVGGNADFQGNLSHKGVQLSTIRSEMWPFDFVASGGIVAQSAGLVGTFSDVVAYIGGVRVTATSVANKTYTASKDTYVDLGLDGVVDYNEVANGAAAPALAANHIRLAKVVTSGAAITSVTQSNFDSLGNAIYRPRGNRQLGYAENTGGLSITSTTGQLVTNLEAPVIIPYANARIRVRVVIPYIEHATGDRRLDAQIWDGVVGSGTQLNAHRGLDITSGQDVPFHVAVEKTIAAAGSKTYRAGAATIGGGTASLIASPTQPAFISVELI